MNQWPERCIACEGGLPIDTWRADTTAQSLGAYPARFAGWTAECRYCYGLNRYVLNEAAGHDHHYDGEFEQMVVGTHYNPLSVTIGQGTRPLGPLWACWAWIPMPQDGAMVRRVVEAIEADEGLRDGTRFRLLILPHKLDPDRFRRVGCRFDEVWHLHAEVMADAVGPYPSLRAERSIKKTLAGRGLRELVHFWPAATLPDRDCRPIATQDEVLQKWSGYARKHVKLEVNP